MTGEEFKAFLKEELAPQLWQGARVVMDNLAAHKVEGVAEILEAVGAKAIYNAPYFCEFNPFDFAQGKPSSLDTRRPSLEYPRLDTSTSLHGLPDRINIFLFNFFYSHIYTTFWAYCPQGSGAGVVHYRWCLAFLGALYRCILLLHS